MLEVLKEELPPNAPRFDAGRQGHVESYFLRANHPTRKLALWVKATVLTPLSGSPLAETWFIFFDGEKHRTFAHKETVPLAKAVFDYGATPMRIGIGETDFAIGDVGRVSGQMTRGNEKAFWGIDFVAAASVVGRPLSIVPWKVLRQGPFPRSKLVTPYPSLRFMGQVTVFGERYEVSDWPGMQGHNWGREHAFEYAWGQCLFPESRHGQEAMVEGFTARVKVGGLQTPRVSALVVRRGGHSWRFDRLFDTWRQQATITGWRWTLKMRGDDGEAALTMDGSSLPMACLGYRNPDGRLSYCFNTKLAHVWLHVQPRTGPAFQLESEHGGALEFLRAQPDPSIPEVV